MRLDLQILDVPNSNMFQAFQLQYEECSIKNTYPLVMIRIAIENDPVEK